MKLSQIDLWSNPGMTSKFWSSPFKLLQQFGFQNRGRFLLNISYMDFFELICPLENDF